jgi:DNA polymerase family B
METQEIQINDALREFGVTKFEKKDTTLKIYMGDKYLLLVDVDKKAQKTLENLRTVAEETALSKEEITKLDRIITRDYDDWLQVVETKQGDSKKDESSSRMVVKLIKKNCLKVFLDNLGQGFAAITVRDHIEVLPIDHPKFRNWASTIYWDATYNETEEAGDTLGSEHLSSALRVIMGEAQRSEEEPIQLYIRVAKTADGTIYYDLVNRNWQGIKITSDGWDVVNLPPIFKRRNHQKIQVLPRRDYPSDIFETFISLLRISKDEDNRLLFQCYIISLFYYGIVHAALMLHGEGGSAKTTRQKLIRLVVDPSATPVLILPKSTEKAAHIIVSHYVCYFDNISYISEEMSDLLCTAITGAGLAKRKLYTDEDDIINEARHCLGITGVNLAATKTDLIDRGLIVEQDAIPETQKKLEVHLFAKLNEILPGLLGYIFDVLVKVLRWQKEHPKGLELDKYPRLADFAEICEIISQQLGNPPMEFINAFKRNIDSRHRRIVNDSAVGRALEIFMEDKGYWNGEMTDLLSDLRGIAEFRLQLQSVKNAKYWPQTSNVLSRRINEIKDSLRVIGIVVERSGADTSQRTYVIENKNFRSVERIVRKLSLSPLGYCLELIDNYNQSTVKPSEISGIFPNILPQVQKKVVGELNSFIAFDLEWNESLDHRIDVVSFVDYKGNWEVKFRDRDFEGSEKRLLQYTMGKLIKYKWSLGWHTQSNSEDIGGNALPDLAVIEKRCKKLGINTIVGLAGRGVPYIKNGLHKHIDLYNVYNKAMVKDGMYKSRYRGNGLADASEPLLGHGKYNDYTGNEFKNLPLEEQIQYSVIDSKLVIELAGYHDFEVLDTMFAIAEITELDFQKVRRTNLATWWGAIFEKLIQKSECPPIERIEFTGSYKGADVLTPKKGLHENSIVVDAMSLYPSVGINFNLSFDTINCNCCKDVSERRLCNLIPNEFTKDCKHVNPSTDWICGKRVGAFPSRLNIFKKKRFEDKKAGNVAKQYAFKILINGGYGVFGNMDYAFYDPRVAELVTAAGRYILSEMQTVANKEYGFEIIYGDTDSLFLKNASEVDLTAFQ